MELQNTHQKKILTQELPTRINFGPMNTHEKILEVQRNHEKKFQTQKIPMRKKVGPTKAWWHLTHRTHDSTHLTKSSKLCFFQTVKIPFVIKVNLHTKNPKLYEDVSLPISDYLFCKGCKKHWPRNGSIKKEFF